MRQYIPIPKQSGYDEHSKVFEAFATSQRAEYANVSNALLVATMNRTASLQKLDNNAIVKQGRGAPAPAHARPLVKAIDTPAQVVNPTITTNIIQPRPLLQLIQMRLQINVMMECMGSVPSVG